MGNSVKRHHAGEQFNHEIKDYENGRRYRDNAENIYDGTGVKHGKQHEKRIYGTGGAKKNHIGICKVINTVACKTAERSGQHVIKKEFLAAHSSFYCCAENIKGKHVEKQMAYRTVSEHVCDKLPV